MSAWDQLEGHFKPLYQQLTFKLKEYIDKECAAALSTTPGDKLTSDINITVIHTTNHKGEKRHKQNEIQNFSRETLYTLQYVR